MHASCHCLVLSEKKCQGAFLCMAVANPTIGRNLLHMGCDGAVSIRFLRLYSKFITCCTGLFRLHLSYYNL